MDFISKYKRLLIIIYFLPTILNYLMLIKKFRIKDTIRINFLFGWTIIVPIALIIEIFINHYKQNQEIYLKNLEYKK